MASASLMYSPLLVFPYQRSAGQWYTLLLLFTHTRPGPPPGAAVAAGAVLFEVEPVAAADEAAGAAGAGATAGAAAAGAGFGAAAALVDVDGAAAVPDEPALPPVLASVPAYQSCTPLCP